MGNSTLPNMDCLPVKAPINQSPEALPGEENLYNSEFYLLVLSFATNKPVMKKIKEV